MKTVLPSFGVEHPVKVIASVVSSFLTHMVVKETQEEHSQDAWRSGEQLFKLNQQHKGEI